MDMSMSSTMAMDMVNSTMNHGHDMEMGNSTMHHHDMGNSTMDHGDMDHGDMDHGDMDHGSMDHSMMHMAFYFGVANVTVLFESWTINNGGQMAGACIGVILLAALYEGLKVLREFMLQKVTMQRKRAHDNGADYRNGVALMDSTVLSRQPSSVMCSWWHLLQTFLHLLQVTVSYALMLIFMTYNGYLAISILIGAAVGYFAFGWKKAVIIDINEHCH